MVWTNFIFSKVKFLIVSLVELFRYVCCFRKSRRKLSSEFVPLSSVGVIPSEKLLQITTDDDHYRNSIPDSVRQPRNVQDHINQYRQQKLRQLSSETSEEVQPDFFQDMQPKIIRQKKVLITTNENQNPSHSMSSRLSFTPISQGNELAAWEEMESTGNWDVDESNTDQILREKRLQERERRMLENMKKRMDKDRNRIASKINS